MDKNLYKETFDIIKADDSLVERVKTALNEKKHRKPFRIMKFVPAIAITFCMTLTVAAAIIGNEGQFKEFFKGYSLGSRYETNKEKSIEFNEDILSQINTKIESKELYNTNKNIKITIKGAIYDKYNAYILFDVVAPKKFIFSDEYEFQMMSDANEQGYVFKSDEPVEPFLNIHSSGPVNIENEINGFSSMTQVPDDNANDNKATFVEWISTSNDLTKKEIQIAFVDLGRNNGTEIKEDEDGDKYQWPKWEDTYKGKWIYSFTLNNPSDMTKTYLANAQVTEFGKKVIISKVEISPLSVTLSYKDKIVTEPFHEYDWDKDDREMTINYKDGQTKKCIISSGSLTGLSAPFSEPINLEKVKSITVGKSEIPIK